MDRHPHGQVRTEVVDDRILVMTVDRVEKKNAFTPKISNELADALTRLDDDPDLFVGVLTFAGDHTTAGLEMPLFFTDEARAAAAERSAPHQTPASPAPPAPAPGRQPPNPTMAVKSVAAARIDVHGKVSLPITLYSESLQEEFQVTLEIAIKIPPRS